MHSLKYLFNTATICLFFIFPALAQYPGSTANGQLTGAIMMNKIEDVKNLKFNLPSTGLLLKGERIFLLMK